MTTSTLSGISVYPEKLERILIELYRRNMSLLFHQTCLKEGLLPN